LQGIAIADSHWTVRTPKAVVEEIKTLKAQDMCSEQLEVGCVKSDIDKLVLIIDR
jgi:hypothetical protein